MFNNLFKKGINDPDGDFEQGKEINEQNTKRNSVLTVIVLFILSCIAFGLYKFTRPANATPQPQREPVDFGTIIEDDFTSKDNQSALSAQQIELDEQRKLITELTKTLQGTADRVENALKLDSAKQQDFEQRLLKRMERFENEQREQAKKQKSELQAEQVLTGSTAPATPTTSAKKTHDAFGTRPLPPRPAPTSKNNPNIKSFQYSSSDEVSFNNGGIDSFDFIWEQSEEEKARRTIENYVPTGTFVTAVVTGGADANAGVLGQGDTVPMVFQTVNQGILPNGEKSRLKDCSITGSAYGDISSSRGIVRTNRMSCIFDDGEIIDLPVRGTVFNFGRNGIRGKAILKNGKIVQMAGISGILTGLGETGKALSETTSTSALGTTSSISGDDAFMNLLGSTTSSVGSKLAEYYIKLAELYHPIVELNPGNLVNIVFLEGFPLDAVAIEQYENEIAAQEEPTSGTNQILDVITNNPLASQVQGQVGTFGTPSQPTSAFGQ